MEGGPAYDPLAPARDLERRLGDPTDPTVAFSFARIRHLDEREEFPEAICDGLTSWGLHEYFVPAQYGGRLHSYEQLLHLVRLVARRDLTAAIGYGKTFLGAVSAWIAATPEQCAGLAAKILAGAPVSWALTERDHGSDLLASEVTATRLDQSYRLTGEKWLINNATRGRLLSVLARTDAAGGARGFGVLLVDKNDLPPGTLTCLPKVQTLGIRGADISGIAFTDAVVPDAAHLGPPGSGIEIVLKGLQLTRTMCASLALGASEHALRIAMDWAAARQLYGRTLADLPMAWRLLLDAYTDQLTAEAAAIVGSRLIHWNPEELSVASAAVKYALPVRSENTIAALGRLLGARSILSGGDFQKVARDARIVSLFDGNTLVNLHAIVAQFPNLVRGYRRGRAYTDVTPAADVSRAVPPFERDRLKLFSRYGLGVVAALPDTAAVLAGLAETAPVLKRAAELAHTLAARTEQLHASIAALPPARGGAPVVHLQRAKEFTECYLGAAAIALWLANHARATTMDTGPLWEGGHWLTAVLRRVLTALGEPAPAEPDTDEILWTHLAAQASSGRMFSLFDCQLAEGMRGA